MTTTNTPTTEKLEPEGKFEIEFYRRPLGYMMATRAFHKLGDLSSDGPDLCRIYGDTREDFSHVGYYVGSWVTGYGFFNVLFPKETTRPLTDEEVDYWSGRSVQIANQPPWGFNVDDLKASRLILEESK
jgi:hypothetical protein